MTELLYNLDSYIKEFDAGVISCDEIKYNGQVAYDVVLDRTCFFPEQGGQDSDTGILSADVEVKVIHASIKDNIVHHITVSPITSGSSVHGKIDWEKRYERMQQHSGEHLVSGTINRLYGFDNVGFHLSDREVTLDFNGTFTDEQIDDIENIVNNAIYENIASHIFFPTREELKQIPYRSKKELEGDIRIVEFPGYDICACCAPHVKFTGEIGIIKIISAEHFRGGTRIWIKCGKRALMHYRSVLKDVVSVSRCTSAKPEEIAFAVQKQCDTVKNLKYSNIRLEKKLLSILSQSISGDRNPLLFLETADADNVREVLNSLISSNFGYCSAFIGTDETGYRFIIGAAELNCRELINTIRNSFDIKGGGTQDMVQGTVKATEAQLRDFWSTL